MIRILSICRLICFCGFAGLVTACGGGTGDEGSNSSPNARSSQSDIGISSQSSSNSSSLSSRTSSSSRSSSSSSSARAVTIEWSHPTERENGTYLELSEIGGYEIRVYDSRTSQFTYYDIKGNTTTRYSLNNYATTMTVEIAAYDTTGLYSEYVPVTN